MRRRHFLGLGAALAALRGAPAIAAEPPAAAAVDFIADGRPLGAQDYARLLLRLADEGRIRPDDYSNGGIVAELEARFAGLLGQEAAVFLPTGTLANHLAVRRLAGQRRRVLVPAESHLFRDSGDCAQSLSGLHLVPLGRGRVCFDAAEAADALRESRGGRVPTPVGALLIETPVRRQHDRMVQPAELDALLGLAREHDVRTHLDGARLFVQAVHTQRAPADYGRRFDTVFTSLWKCFNAPAGAVLAGPRTVLAGLADERRMFGGSLPAAWPLAAVALHFADTFLAEYGRALQRALALFAALERRTLFRAQALPDGSHVFRLTVLGVEAERFRQAARARGLRLPPPSGDAFLLKINPTLSDAPDDLESRFVDAHRAAQ